MSDGLQELPISDELASELEHFMRDEEIENICNLNGWAVGNVVHPETGERLENVVIETFSGEGIAGQFPGVNVFAVVNGDWKEFKAHPNKSSFNESGNPSSYYVEEYIEGKDLGF